MGVNGLLNVNKPAGCTSFSIVAGIRRLSGERRVGHAGTLDPAASGVLPVCLGQATRVAEYLLQYPKEYVAGIEMGISTDTYDGEGRVTGRGPLHNISLASVEHALRAFEGAIDQVPPAFSAVKIGGRKAYDLARAGQDEVVAHDAGRRMAARRLGSRACRRCVLGVTPSSLVPIELA